ncbi:DinB family protein [Pleomorphomonas sp. PLEO]|uniref:DinB family protein n=1 Tax=Pleomorphomonas sp. PLEO TaxID=3239306 RepID=UPI00351DE90F
MTRLFQQLYSYHAWANSELFDKLALVEDERHRDELQAMLALISHAYVVARIFAGHLEGVAHGFTSDNLEQPPALGDLRAAVAATDTWYLDYVRQVSPAALAEAVDFTFTDGDQGRMTREEMLTHVVLHAGYHRGEVGRLLRQISASLPWDTFAVYLHQSEPGRRGRADRHA